MDLKILGVTASGSEAQVVLLSKTGGDFRVDGQSTLKLQAGRRPAAYGVLYNQFKDYISQNKIQFVCIKGSAVSGRSTTLAHLEGAELRGVLLAAASNAGIAVKLTIKGQASKTFGERKVDEYLKDDHFWEDRGLSSLRKGMREAAFSAIFHFDSP